MLDVRESNKSRVTAGFLTQETGSGKLLLKELEKIAGIQIGRCFSFPSLLHMPEINLFIKRKGCFRPTGLEFPVHDEAEPLLSGFWYWSLGTCSSAELLTSWWGSEKE